MTGNPLSGLFDEIDNSSLVFFRIFFGLLLFLESAGAIATGWVHETFIEPEFTFTFIGFEWLQPLPGIGMYIYFGVMAVFGIGVMLGFRYRLCMGGFTVLWSIVYLMQKSHYNNHYYLLILLCFLMFLVPANQYLSLDSKRNPSIRKLTCPRWCYLIFILQLWIVYTYAGIVKFYPGWLDGDFVRILFSSRDHFPIVGSLLQKDWLHKLIIYGGIVFDLGIIYLLLWKRTRYLGVFLSFLFHLFNSVILHIGIFPYLMLAMDILFFPPEDIRAMFWKKKPAVETIQWTAPFKLKQKTLIYGLGIYFIIQVLLPLRPYFFDGNVFWTEEGHRMSWRMMLRSKFGRVSFKIVMPSGETEIHYPGQYISPNQKNALNSKPDVIWQYAQRLKHEYLSKGVKVEIYADAHASLNGGPLKQIIDPNINLAEESWDRFKHKKWIISYP